MIKIFHLFGLQNLLHLIKDWAILHFQVVLDLGQLILLLGQDLVFFLDLLD